jgi:hypothetical protein
LAKIGAINGTQDRKSSVAKKYKFFHQPEMKTKMFVRIKLIYGIYEYILPGTAIA